MKSIYSIPSEHRGVLNHVSGHPDLPPVYFTKRLVGLFDLAHVRSLHCFSPLPGFPAGCGYLQQNKALSKHPSPPSHTRDGNWGWLEFPGGSQWTMCFTSRERIPSQLKTFQQPRVSRPDCTSGLRTDPSLTSCWFTLHVGMRDADS